MFDPLEHQRDMRNRAARVTGILVECGDPVDTSPSRKPGGSQQRTSASSPRRPVDLTLTTKIHPDRPKTVSLG